ncbi:hypothetical protein BDV98DRAFT_414158 [Pterulicium gracile]|uniref:F-box domain-containing protein n=1 Tax=Pterulicium gracile TaxID=1884261 RepID=A0A5C3QXF7_9AGAR|nr:hypothetical protein BDV98DRAFT_414158 [Pterula gracilis]
MIFTENWESNDQTPPWILSAVCRRWRGIINNYPVFWSCYDFIPKDMEKPNATFSDSTYNWTDPGIYLFRPR